jgi:hypothetical protein
MVMILYALILGNLNSNIGKLVHILYKEVLVLVTTYKAFRGQTVTKVKSWENPFIIVIRQEKKIFIT